MINMVLFADQSTRFGIVTYVMAVLLQTFPLCFYCNAIVDDCNELADALFHSSWWMQDKRYQRTVLQFLQKLQQPMTFTAMNIFNINLATNINVSSLISKGTGNSQQINILAGGKIRLYRIRHCQRNELRSEVATSGIETRNKNNRTRGKRTYIDL